MTVARSRSISARAAASSACSGLCPGRRPGTEAANASSAPCFAVLHTCTTVERSTPNFAAASRWVACWVRTCTNNSYFSEGANRLRDLLPAEDLGLTSDICSNLSRRKRTESLAGY